MTYCGAVTARAGDVRAYRNPNGHGFRLEHEPLEGREGHAHTHVCQDPATGIVMTRADKNELKLKLGEIFSVFDQHSCAAAK